jgi:hypothetical protein
MDPSNNNAGKGNETPPPTHQIGRVRDPLHTAGRTQCERCRCIAKVGVKASMIVFSSN